MSHIIALCRFQAMQCVNKAGRELFSIQKKKEQMVCLLSRPVI